MSYIDAIIDKEKNQIVVVERRNDGKRYYKTYPTEYLTYWPSEKGKFESIFGNKLEKYKTNNWKEFQKEIKLLSGKKLHESDINPIFRCLYENYRSLPAPDLNIGYFDIETDFSKDRGFSSSEEAFMPITAITIFVSNHNKNYTLVVAPKGITSGAAQSIVDKFENTLLCENEKQLLETFLMLIEDVDILTGWNCLDENSPIFLEDRIIKIKNCKSNQKLISGEQILKTHNSGKKEKLVIELDNGLIINSSEDHKFPIISKKFEKYTNLNQMKNNGQVMNLKSIEKHITDNHVYFKLELKGNNNLDLTWGQYIKNNLNLLLEYHWFDIVITEKNLKNKIWNFYKDCGKLESSGFTRSEYKNQTVPKLWSFKKHKGILTTEDIELLLNQDVMPIYLNKVRGVINVNMNEVIDKTYWKLLGFIFTDGFYSKYDNCFSICNKREDVISYYAELLNTQYKLKRQDNCYYANRNNGMLKLLSPFIYTNEWKKVINIELFSRCSISQFSQFISSSIDGDGSVGDSSVSICEFQNNSESFQTLFSWFGIYSNRRADNISVPFHEHNNQFLNMLELSHGDKKAKLLERRMFVTVGAPNKKLKQVYDKVEKSFYIRIRNIKRTGLMVCMFDIMTESQYFICNGAKVHNSTSYDVPYTHNRIIQVLGKEETRKLCLLGKFPKKREYTQYGKEQITYDLIGRVHIDYLDLYKKHVTHEMHSYRLDYVGEVEVGDRKTPYEGTLDQLYNNDFEKFIEYNRQDVLLLVKIDKKLKFIQLANEIAHTNTVLIPTTMGAVALIDQAIVNFAWNKNLHVPTRERETIEERNIRHLEEEESGVVGIVGAYVADPKPGLHDWIGGVDINSLYPSTIRALNMSPETVIGQIRSDFTDELIKSRMSSKILIDDAKVNLFGPDTYQKLLIDARTSKELSFADAWHEMFGTLEYNWIMDQTDTVLTIDFEDGSEVRATAAEIYELIFDGTNKWMLSANGTILDISKAGLIPTVLSTWYAERKSLQAKAKEFDALASAETDPDKKKELLAQYEHYDRLQYIKKILLNSLYGAVGNMGSRWFDVRIAQSTTLSGRCIAKHMNGKINDILTGDYNHKGAAVIYSDTDSSYFSAYKVMMDEPEFADYEWTPENVIKLYDSIGDMTNASFPEFMKQAFNCPEENGKLIKASRELCASKGLFITKKRYAVMIFDKEGKRKDKNGPGEVKVMGMDLKRSDTPKPVQEFLFEVLTSVLTGGTKETVLQQIADFRIKFKDWPSWEKGSPKRVNNLTYYGNVKNNQESPDVRKSSVKKMIPGHVLASINWNNLKKIYNDAYSVPIMDGAKVIVCKVKPNPAGITSVAYPTDQHVLPEWFRTLPFDTDLMETTLIDKKIGNLLDVLNWDLSQAKSDSSFSDLFQF
jgi:DNA polymerase elongation subunit (family B)